MDSPLLKCLAKAGVENRIISKQTVADAAEPVKKAGGSLLARGLARSACGEKSGKQASGRASGIAWTSGMGRILLWDAALRWILPLGIMAAIVSVTVLLPVWMFRQNQLHQSELRNELGKVRDDIVYELKRDMTKIMKAEISEYRESGIIEEIPELAEMKIDQAMERLGIHELGNQELALYTAGNIAGPAAGPGAGGGMAGPGMADLNPMETEPIRQETRKEKAVESALQQRGGILLPKGTLQLEPSFTTAHFSSKRIKIEGFSILPVLVIGEISTESVQRDIFMSSMSARYGLWHDLQVEVKAPYRYEHDRITSNLGSEEVDTVTGLGDVEASLSYQIARENGLIPDTIISMGIKAPTGADPYFNPIGLGTGHWGVRAGIVGVKTSDPVVIYGTLNGIWNLEKEYDKFGLMDPGNTVSYAVGTAMALSYRTALSFQFEHSISQEMKQENNPINGTFVNAASFKAGFTWTVSENMGVDIGVSMGLTEDAPDYTLDLRLPYTFG